MISVLPCCMPRGNFDFMVEDTGTLLRDLVHVPEWYIQMYIDDDRTVAVLDTILAARRNKNDATSTNLTFHIGEKVRDAVPSVTVPRVRHLMLTSINNRPWWGWMTAMSPHTIRIDHQRCDDTSISGRGCRCTKNDGHQPIVIAPSVRCLWLDLVTNAKSTMVMCHLSGFGLHINEFHLRLLAHDLLTIRRRTLSLLNAIGRFLQCHLQLQTVTIDLSNTNWKYDAIPTEYLDRFVEMSTVLLDVLHANTNATIHDVRMYCRMYMRTRCAVSQHWIPSRAAIA